MPWGITGVLERKYNKQNNINESVKDGVRFNAIKQR